MNKIQGKILLKETGIGIPNLLVVVYDIDSRKTNDIKESYKDETQEPQPKNINYFWAKINGDRLGSVITNNNGEFELSYEDNEFMVDEKKEARPDLVLFVLAPEVEQESLNNDPLTNPNLTVGTGVSQPNLVDPKILFLSNSIRANAGKTESYLINISKEKLATAGIVITEKVTETEKKSDLIKKTIEQTIELNKTLKEALTNATEAKLKEAKKVRDTAKSIFKPTMLSTASPEMKASNNYLNPGDDLKTKHNDVITNSLRKLRIKTESAWPPKLKIVDAGKGKSPKTQTEVNHLLRKEERGTSIERITSAFPNCIPEHKAGEFLNSIIDPPAESLSPCADTAVSISTPSSPPLGISGIEEFVKGRIAQYYSNVSAVEDRLNISISNQRANQCDIQLNINTLEFRGGASDASAIHDFYVLKIAFENIWKEVFDEKVSDSTRTLYETYAKLQNAYSGLPSPEEITIESVESKEDLIQYINEIKSCLGILKSSTDVPPEVKIFLPTIDNEMWASFDPTDQGTLIIYSNSYSDWARDLTSSDINVIKTAKDKINDLKVFAESIIERYKSPLTKIENILVELTQQLTEAHKFDIFAPETFNFGVLLTYRQTWTPGSFQVGDLVSTIPLAPKETRKYSKKTTVKKSRQQKETENSSQSKKQDADTTARVDSEIVNKANSKTNFKANAEGGMAGIWNASAGFETDSASESAQTKKDFREAVKKSAEEYKQEHKTEVDATSSSEFEENVSGEITNTNDEITVTYLFYELQRQYNISEKLNKITPVILVAREVPAPHEIDEEWIIANDWILKRVILDDSFLTALNYITTSLEGDNLSLDILKANLDMLTGVVNELKGQIAALTNNKDVAFEALQNQKDWLAHVVYENANSADIQGSQSYVDIKKDAYDTILNEINNLQSSLSQNSIALQQSVDKYNMALQNHLNKQTEILRLKVHFKNNILYYMQKIWDMEVPDQRFFALYNIEVPNFEITEGDAVEFTYNPNPLGGTGVTITYPAPTVDLSTKYKLHEIADLDTVLGYKGNYIIFPLKVNNALTNHLMQEYIQITDGIIEVRDPDPIGNYNGKEFREMVKCIYDRSVQETGSEEFFNTNYKESIKEMYMNYITSARLEHETIVVPTKSLYIEALPGKHPLLEDFKLMHREMDVRKVQAEVRHAELENLRLAARLLKGESDDPEIDKKIVVDGGRDGIVTPTE